jgi:ubiquinol-cytochrome c reductase cytochrome c subunit
MILAGLSGFFLVGLLALAGPSPQVSAQEGFGGRPDEATLALFAAQCSPCHGANGEGGVGPALASSVLSLEDRIQLITDGRGGMPSFASALTTDEIDTLALMVDSFAVAEIYASQCAPCHGAAGGGGIGPDLLTSDKSFEDQLAIVTDGLGGMPAFGPTIEAERLQAVVAFVADFAEADTAGGAIFASQCAPCHGAAGEGGVGPNLQVSTLSSAELIALVSHGAGAMSTFGGALTPAEIELVAAYAESLRIVPPEEPGELDDGSAAIYAEQCAGCHGEDASGGIAPALLGTELAVDGFEAIVSNGSGSMPAFGDALSDADIGALASWLAELSAAPGDQSALVAAGAEVYSANCATCHGVDASGGTGPALTATTLGDDEIASVVGSGQGAMPGFAETLSTDDITALIAYIETAVEAASPSEPATGPATISGQAVFIANCATCHGADGGGGSGPSLIRGKLTANEIISQVYGGHAQNMPAFEGVLAATEVQEVARYVLELPESGSDGISLGTVALFLGLIGVVILGGLWAAGRLGNPPVSDVDIEAAGDTSWQEPLPPRDDELPPGHP